MIHVEVTQQTENKTELCSSSYQTNTIIVMDDNTAAQKLEDTEE